jgi:hypothetical protein
LLIERLPFWASVGCEALLFPETGSFVVDVATEARLHRSTPTVFDTCEPSWVHAPVDTVPAVGELLLTVATIAIGFAAMPTASVGRVHVTTPLA